MLNLRLASEPSIPAMAAARNNKTKIPPIISKISMAHSYYYVASLRKQTPGSRLRSIARSGVHKWAI